MAVATRPDRFDVDPDLQRPVLSLLYMSILIGEVTVLGTLVAMFGRRPPAAYELGWVGAGSMIVMQLYSVRRRVRALRNLGSLRTWLDAHIFLGLQGWIFVAYHSIGIAMSPTLAAVNFALVTIVVITGAIGRYLYGFLPRARAGHAIAYAELASALGPRALPVELRRECRGLWDLVALDVRRRRALRELAPDPEIRRSIQLASWISALEVAERWFSRWTLFHRPLAVLVFGITALHVLAHFAYAT